jgi:hypothetical protein
MGRQASCIHVKPPGFHGKEFTGKRTHGKTGLPRKVNAELKELKLALLAESEAL